MLISEFFIMVNQPTLLSTQLFYKNRVVEVTLNRVMLGFWKEIETRRKRSASFNCISKDADHHFLLVSEIVGARETKEEEDQTNKDGGRKHRVLLYPYAFTVSYTERTKHHCWRCKDIIFHCLDEAQRQQWVQTINNQLSLLSIRPKRLLVYINPYSGKQRGKWIYEQRVAPLFSRASISTDVIVTESANHARDHLKTEVDLKQCDGVVCVGGDGMFSEVVHGLVSRTQSDSRVDQNQPNQDLVPCALRIGIIPAGSTDCICYSTTGTNDPVTSALHIIMGDSQPMDVCSVHHNNTFLRYSVSLLGYGFYGDVLTDSERKRWMGPSRYDFSGLKTFLTHQYYEGTVAFLPAEDNLGNPRDKIKCMTGCHICEQGANNGQLLSLDHVDKMAEENSDKETSGDGVWRVIRGKFLAINAASMSCACPRSPRGLSPYAHLADGTTDLILVRKASRLDFLRHLIRHTNKDDQFDMSFVEVHRVRRFRFVPKQSNGISEVDLSETSGKKICNQVCTAHPNNDTGHSNWNCDGEILPHADIQVSVHCQLIRLFARGVERRTTFDTYTWSVIEGSSLSWQA
ncbi:ceramide kinase isoform X1 [Oncorhynchus kisutch]|uniref:Ceramide kinase n=2 Tax=Oncorhynchus kisutch TaxID=8019 RepID=A0A8C7GXU8_ONCKI|nr:ceramide kinase isoform X1 [Oncorhynchus kisutch]